MANSVKFLGFERCLVAAGWFFVGCSGTNPGVGGNTGGAALGGQATSGGSSNGGHPAGGQSAAGGTVSNGGFSATGGKSATGGAGTGATGGSVGTPNVTIDRTKTFQTIEGFGFFGAQDVWWGNASDMWSDAWGTLAITDLGITMWRNEYYSEEANQDANFAKQKPVVQGLKRIADANRVPLKFIYTVWTPPSSMKCTVDSVQAGKSPCTPHPDGLKNGGTLDPSKYNAFTQWLIQGVKNYADAGVDLYALSPQNEPMFVESYNSCVYDVDATKLNSYSKMIQAVAPLVKQAYPNVKIFGTENMLGLEGQQWFYSAYMDSAAWADFDVLAYHGYQDGVAPTASSQLAQYWTYVRTNWAVPHNKPSWMTETSGYTDTWTSNTGARTLGFAIYSALAYGQASAWVWWQGSELGSAPGEYNLMQGTKVLSKRYYVSKQFYRYIRPGAKMVQTTSSDSTLFVVAFTHATMGSFTVVVINTASQDKGLVLGGSDIPSTFDAYRTSATENCVSVGSVTNGSITLKADSITTLVNGNVYE
jgi:glucuronoarabinoxylan endo-1,4-beta-xylanase